MMFIAAANSWTDTIFSIIHKLTVKNFFLMSSSDTKHDRLENKHSYRSHLPDRSPAVTPDLWAPRPHISPKDARATCGFMCGDTSWLLPQDVEDRLKSRFATPEVRTEKRDAGVLEIVLAVSGVVLIVIYQEPDVGGDA